MELHALVPILDWAVRAARRVRTEHSRRAGGLASTRPEERSFESRWSLRTPIQERSFGSRWSVRTPIQERSFGSRWSLRTTILVGWLFLLLPEICEVVRFERDSRNFELATVATSRLRGSACFGARGLLLALFPGVISGFLTWSEERSFDSRRSLRTPTLAGSAIFGRLENGSMYFTQLAPQSVLPLNSAIVRGI